MLCVLHRNPVTYCNLKPTKLLTIYTPLHPWTIIPPLNNHSTPNPPITALTHPLDPLPKPLHPPLHPYTP